MVLYDSIDIVLYDSTDIVLYDSTDIVLYDSIDMVLYDSTDIDLYDSTDMVLYRCVDDKIGFLRTYCSLTNYNRGCLKKGHSEHLSIDSTIFPVQIF
mgnify:CR=1 FL=1